MSSIPFCKFHGFGNDYIVIERSDLPRGVALSELAKAICHRHTGAGADGIAVLEKRDSGDADYFCDIVNPDGSFAGFSGNGTRCAVASLYYEDRWTKPALRLETRSGVKNYTLVEREAEASFWFRAEIGKPRFGSREIPVRTGASQDYVIDLEVKLSDSRVLVSCVDVGNPVACMFVDGFDLDWRAIGRELEVHPVFPERANIVFVKVFGPEKIELRIWERGAGETSASGTCASGAAVLSAFTGRTRRRVSVQSPGGTTDVEWREDDEILITGRADLAYYGEWPVIVPPETHPEPLLENS